MTSDFQKFLNKRKVFIGGGGHLFYHCHTTGLNTAFTLRELQMLYVERLRLEAELAEDPPEEGYPEAS